MRSKKAASVIASGSMNLECDARRRLKAYRAPTNCFFLSAISSSWMLAGTFL
jgi:hypothetical protein